MKQEEQSKEFDEEQKTKQAMRPTILCIFGITGDLSRKKLLGSVWDLYVRGLLPEKFSLLGFSRQELSREKFLAYVEEVIRAHRDTVDDEKMKVFLEKTSYHAGLFEEVVHYCEIDTIISRVEQRFGECANRLFYLAVPPAFYGTILDNISASGLARHCSEKDGWTRILIEKPFGRDLATAKELDMKLGKLFNEEQIFRIDHYLAKETTQNILNFRFSNYIFEPLWNSAHIERIDVEMYEDIDVGTRGAFYDSVGALRDIGQNHMLQLLAAVTMDNPGEFSSKAIRRKRYELLKTLAPVKDISSRVLRAQYEGYRNIDGVDNQSQTETFFRIKTQLLHPNWRGVPIYLSGGKALEKSMTRVVVHFRTASLALCPIDKGAGCHNMLSFDVKPEEGIRMCFWARKPIFGRELEMRKMSFMYREDQKTMQLPDAYEYILHDCICGDQTLFTGTDEVIALWSFVTPILEKWHEEELKTYPKGSSPYDIIGNTTEPIFRSELCQ